MLTASIAHSVLHSTSPDRLSEGRVVFSTWLDTVKRPLRHADHFLQWVHVLTTDDALGTAMEVSRFGRSENGSVNFLRVHVLT